MPGKIYPVKSHGDVTGSGSEENYRFCHLPASVTWLRPDWGHLPTLVTWPRADGSAARRPSSVSAGCERGARHSPSSRSAPLRISSAAAASLSLTSALNCFLLVMTERRDDRFLRRRVGELTAHTQTLLTLFKSGDEAALPGLTSSAGTWFDVTDWTPPPVVLRGTTAIVCFSCSSSLLLKLKV